MSMNPLVKTQKEDLLKLIEHYLYDQGYMYFIQNL